MQWAIFCTIYAETYNPDDPGRPQYSVGEDQWWLCRVVDNEIDAVATVASHVQWHGDHHLPFIHMAPVPEGFEPEFADHEWQLDELRTRGFDFERNLYVQPETIPVSWGVKTDA